MRKYSFLFIMLCLLPAPVMAEGGWYFGAGNGYALVDDDEFEEGTMFRILGGYAFTSWFGIDTASYFFDRIPSRRHDEVFIQGYGQSLGVNAGFAVKTVNVDFNAGMFAWRMESHAYGETIGEDQGSSPYVGFGVRVKLPLNMVMGGSSTFFHDVSGADLSSHSLFFGLGF